MSRHNLASRQKVPAKCALTPKVGLKGRVVVEQVGELQSYYAEQ